MTVPMGENTEAKKRKEETNMKKRILSLLLALLMIVGTVLTMVSCGEDPEPDGPDGPDGPNGETSKYDPEKRPFSMSIQTPDGVFNPFFSTSAYDSAIIGHTQIGMLNTDKEGNIICGESEPTVVRAYTVAEETKDGKKYTTYRFLIKNGIKFSDGEPLTIKDVLFNLYVYLDPAYTGSATIYSTDIVGLKNYRQQSENVTDDGSDSFEDMFLSRANERIDTLIDYVKDYGIHKNDDRPGRDWDGKDAAKKAKAEKDFATVAETFRKELETDYNNTSRESYEDWGFTEVWQIFLYNDGGRSSELLKDDPTREGFFLKDKDGNYQLDPAKAQIILENEIEPYIAEHPELSRDEAIKAYCIASVFEAYFPLNEETGAIDVTLTTATEFEKVVRYWATAQTILDRFTAEEKSDYFANSASGRVVPNITGITTERVTSFDGKTLDGEYDVLSIKINDVDPKAIYNFAFTVSPMHYYSTRNWKGKDYIAAFNGVDEFGLEFGSIDFMNEVINASTKVGRPVGAGPYMASNASGSGTVTGDNFFNNNFVYYERNPYFYTVGKELSNAKIKYIRYKVVESDQIINALANGDIDYGDPSATQENIAAAASAGLGHVEIKTSGYGYVGINPRFIPDVTVRRAIMKAMNTATITENYYKGGLAERIWRPMSTTSWAYPKGAKTYVYNEGEENELSYAFDNTGYEIEEMLEAAGYEKVDGIYQKTIPGFGVDRLSGQNYKFTIAGGSTDHPAYKMFLDAAKILNAHGMDVKVVTSQTALSDLSSGKLSVWAAAWSSTVDPDMYQVYHMDSQASSTSNWGYKQIKAGKNTEAYKDEYAIITELSALIDQGRSTTDKDARTKIYAKALDKIMELAVEMPTYQRKDMSAYNKDVLKEASMTPESERSPYNGLLSRIWELTYN